MKSLSYKNNKKILITGINGFIGSSCADYFTQQGFEIFGIDIFGAHSTNFIQGEVDLENLKLFNHKFDVIIHLAGSGTVGAAQKAPELEHLKTVKSAENILEYMKLHNSNAKLIYSSSAAVYGNSYTKKIKEDFEVNPISIYGKHKIEVEKLCENYSKNNGLNINIIRFFSIYGEGLKKQLLWDFCNRLNKSSNTKTIDCFGTGEEKRDFIHISDAIRFIEILLDIDNKFEIFNCGTGTGISVQEILDLICKEFDYKRQLVFDNIVKEGDPKILISDISKAKDLGFNPIISLEKGIKNYVKWFGEYTK